jgi:hypothetical protein
MEENVAQSELPIFDPGPGEKKALDCVEIYLPKRLRFLSRLYRFLRRSVKYRTGQITLDGFTVFEGYVMRVLVYEYAKGGRAATQTTDDGGGVVSEWTGPRKFDARLCAFIEVSCDNTENGVERLLEGLAWLSEEVKKRKDQYSEKKTPKKKKAIA